MKKKPFRDITIKKKVSIIKIKENLNRYYRVSRWHLIILSQKLQQNVFI